MPHITLLYPFRPRDQFSMLAHDVSLVCKEVTPFMLKLPRFEVFVHSRRNHTLWLAPEPKEPVMQLHALLSGLFPDCMETQLSKQPFVPHLSVAQAGNHSALHTLLSELRASWSPPRFTVWEISFVWRSDPPDDVFRVGQTVRLGGC
jgi:2'-5' RNA ligase